MRIAVVRRYPGCPAGLRAISLSLVMLGLIDSAALAPLAAVAVAFPGAGIAARAALAVVTGAGIAAAAVIVAPPRLAGSKRALRFRLCTATGRSMSIDQSTRDYFDVGDREQLAYEEKLERYRELADAHLQASAFAEFRDTALPHLDEVMVEYIESAEFDELLMRIVRVEEQLDMQESLIERSRVLVRAWAADEHAAAR